MNERERQGIRLLGPVALAAAAGALSWVVGAAVAAGAAAGFVYLVYRAATREAGDG